MTKIYWNGKIVSPEKVSISPLNGGFLFGEFLFESLPVYGGKPLFLKEHLKRVKRGCRFLGWSFLPENEFEKAIRLFSEMRGANSDFLIRFNLVQELEGSGNPRDFTSKKPTLFALARPLRHHLGDKQALSGKVGISPWKATDPETLPNAFKIPYYLTTRSVFRKNPGWDEMLKLNHRGDVVDGGASTPFWFDGKKVNVPPLKLGGLESVTRNKIILMIRELGVRVTEKTWKPDELFKKKPSPNMARFKWTHGENNPSNHELFFVGSGVGVMTASHLENKRINGVPRLAAKLWQLYQRRVREMSSGI